ncbi:Acetophenone carboxylase gamma subunit [Micromonospora sp. MH33]|uniref:hydantoinase/oxoprolinase family protein n=1 Tax=Micromonospora sp. MH33 TaxID=1945509 RepID=UPI000D14A792|nr:hydantoinase/oxoprolinase family protein [Micromonospora sp. MH33]PSK67282.1 Acetophenone carboxylase gamma subunit [Micromonospora sp. MH33]
MTLRIGVDTGGTFTDICAYDETSGDVHVRKVSSTPDDPGRAIVTGVLEILEQIGGRTPEEVSYFAHGTTVGTNALLTYRGVPTAVITTRGFRDLLELGRGRRPRLYDLQADKPEALARRAARFEVTERVRHDGRVETPLDEDDVRRAAAAIRDLGIRSVAVCLLYSFLRPEHERRIREILHAELGPDVFVTLSCEVLPEFREFERLSTTVVNAYVGPVVADYLAALRGRLGEIRLGVTPHVTQSNGGIIPFEAAEKFPVRMVLSGPSTGVVGAAGIATAAGHPDIITFDMGGTSSDVSLVRNGQPKVTNGMELDGRPIRSPMLDIHTVGAGGGSIAWIDAGNHLKVGPASAGSDPGPACYGKGAEATVTDANVVLRTLNPDYLLDGQMAIDSAAAEKAVADLAGRLGLTVEAAAQGIIRVVVANMARAIRVISVQRGYDPRDYTLVPFGGAGPLHASWLARELGISTILVPPTPGAQSALGLLMTDIRADFSRTSIRPLDAAHLAGIRELQADLTEQVDDWFAAEQVPDDARRLEYAIELRYVGQNYELPVALPAGLLTEDLLPEVLDRFAVEHERLYGYSSPGDPVEAVTYRAQGIGQVPTAKLATRIAAGAPVEDARIGDRDLRIAEVGGRATVPVYHRSRLEPGHRITGPALIEQMDTTTVVLPGDEVAVDEHLNLIVRVAPEQASSAVPTPTSSATGAQR